MAKLSLAILLLATVIVTSAVAQTGPTQITFGDYRDLDPVVSPDGNYLAFSSNRTGQFNIYVRTLLAGSTAITQVTQGEKDDRYPAWGRDNRKLLFSSKRTGNSDIYETTRDGSSGYLLVTSSDLIEEYPGYGPKGAGFIFANGKQKTLRLRPQMKVAYAAAAGNVMSPRLLSDGDEPSLSPDGRKIVFVSRRTKNNDIWLVNLDGSGQTQLTTDGKDDENPRFSADGRKIVFASNRTGNFDIWMMDADGGNQRQLTFGEQDETQPFWSAGGYIYYSLKRSEGKANIYRIKAP